MQDQHHTTTTYEYTTNTGHHQGLAPTTEFSHSTGHHPSHMEHSSYSTGNLGKSYDFSSTNPPNFGTYGGSSNPNPNQTSTYEYSRTVGNPSQLSATPYDYTQPTTYERERKSANAGSNYVSTYEPYDVHHHHEHHEQPVRSYERTVVFTHSDPISSPYHHGQEHVVKAARAPAHEKHHSHHDESDEDAYDFNDKEDIINLMADEHRHIKGTEPIVTITKTTTSNVHQTSTDYPRKSAAELLKDLPITSAEIEKKSHVSTTDHHIQEWVHHKKLLKPIHDTEEEYEETRLDYCGLCVSKRRGRKPKY